MPVRKCSEASLTAQAGRSLTSPLAKRNSEHDVVSNLPVRSLKVASRHFLGVASTPPHEEGNKIRLMFHTKSHSDPVCYGEQTYPWPRHIGIFVALSRFESVPSERRPPTFL